jgi:FKBP-type peptidyl-prolyl cis-trans isomerase SlyD
MQFEGVPEGADDGDDDDDEDVLIYRVTEIADDKVVLDGNHPLAGMALIFTCTVTAVRPATADEISARAHARR